MRKIAESVYSKHQRNISGISSIEVSPQLKSTLDSHYDENPIYPRYPKGDEKISWPGSRQIGLWFTYHYNNGILNNTLGKNRKVIIAITVIRAQMVI